MKRQNASKRKSGAAVRSSDMVRHKIMWAVVNPRGYICHVRQTRQEAINRFMAPMPPGVDKWRQHKRWGMRCVKVIVSALPNAKLTDGATI
jgi:hypothetical protein